jgi:hypothetical protein
LARSPPSGNGVQQRRSVIMVVTYSDDVKVKLAKQVLTLDERLQQNCSCCRVGLGHPKALQGSKISPNRPGLNHVLSTWTSQVEFYFSDSNLPKDRFLKTTVSEEPGGSELALVNLSP